MKITKSQLKQIIKEELETVLNEETPRQRLARQARGAENEMEDEFGDWDEPAPRAKMPQMPKDEPAPRAKMPGQKPRRGTTKTTVVKGTLPPGVTTKIRREESGGRMWIIATATTKDGVSAEGKAKFRGNVGLSKSSAEGRARVALLRKLQAKTP